MHVLETKDEGKEELGDSTLASTIGVSLRMEKEGEAAKTTGLAQAVETNSAHKCSSSSGFSLLYVCSAAPAHGGEIR